MAAASAARESRHEIRALLRAHLAAASRCGHVTRQCSVCHRLLTLAIELERAEDESPTDP
ncbi:DUF6274 family protein [Streptomyces sp. NBC_01353]|uniref:DUF6274 family protein n=1 Tax=Streptomyces sp. NBC_01353 TaxID=2903835 RepID=UPI002E35948B|nr:DUF6274 family protein [Streptomyces sp. NBC_01353]